MLYVYLIRDASGDILSVHATLAGIVTYLIGIGDGMLPGDVALTIDALEAVMQKEPSVLVSYPDDDDVTVECYAVMV